MNDGFAELFFNVSDYFSIYRAETEDHVIKLRRVIQSVDRFAPHELDGAGWDAYLAARS